MTTTRTRQKTTLTILAGLSLVGTLAGCAADDSAVAETASTTENTETATPTETTVPTPEATEAAGTYADGTYSSSGSYQAPSGTETIDVTVTLADDVITSVSVVNHGSDREAQQYQSEFADGIAAVVVGQDIDTIAVSRVAGSSLTSGGFTEALEAIKAEAA